MLSLFFLSFVLVTCSIASSAYEYAWFPASALDVTQLPYETASHGNCNALDILPHGRAFAPFTGVIKQIDRNWGFVLFQSKKKVHYANGKLDYMTIGFLHDENVKKLKVGQVIKQGKSFYDAGGQGMLPNGSYGHYCDNHIDMSILKGKVNSVTRYGVGNVYAYDALFINPNKTTSIINKGKKSPYTSLTKGTVTNWSNMWKTLPSTQTPQTPETPQEPVASQPIPSTKITPTTVKSVTNDISKALTIRWKRVTKVSGYEVHVARNSTFTTARQRIKIKGNKTTEAIFPVKKGKTYYVRVRAYKGTKYSSWSKVEKITIKK